MIVEGWAFLAHPTGISMQLNSARNDCHTQGEGEGPSHL